MADLKELLGFVRGHAGTLGYGGSPRGVSLWPTKSA